MWLVLSGSACLGLQQPASAGLAVFLWQVLSESVNKQDNLWPCDWSYQVSVEDTVWGEDHCPQSRYDLGYCAQESSAAHMAGAKSPCSLGWHTKGVQAALTVWLALPGWQ